MSTFGDDPLSAPAARGFVLGDDPLSQPARGQGTGGIVEPTAGGVVAVHEWRLDQLKKIKQPTPPADIDVEPGIKYRTLVIGTSFAPGGIYPGTPSTADDVDLLCNGVNDDAIFAAAFGGFGPLRDVHIRPGHYFINARHDLGQNSMEGEGYETYIYLGAGAGFDTDTRSHIRDLHLVGGAGNFALRIGLKVVVERCWIDAATPSGFFGSNGGGVLMSFLPAGVSAGGEDSIVRDCSITGGTGPAVAMYSHGWVVDNDLTGGTTHAVTVSTPGGGYPQYGGIVSRNIFNSTPSAPFAAIYLDPTCRQAHVTDNVIRHIRYRGIWIAAGAQDNYVALNDCSNVGLGSGWGTVPNHIFNAGTGTFLVANRPAP